MKPWKLLIGTGVACAACCAAPVITGETALGLGASGLFAGAAGMLGAATRQWWLPIAAGAIAVGAMVAWRVLARRNAVDAGPTCALPTAAEAPAATRSCCGSCS